MNPSILVLLLHVGALIKAVKDLETTVGDVVHGNFKKEDVKALLDDINELVADKVITIPGLTVEQIQSALADLQKQI